MTLRSLQIASILLVLALLLLARRSSGHARPTPAGLAFPIKPVVLAARLLAVLVYFALFAYPLWISRQSIPGWLLLLLFIAVLFGLFQLPGTLVLTPDSLVQRFWFRTPRRIPYSSILRITGNRAGTLTRVYGTSPTPGNAPVSITHSFNHADPARFRAELARLSGKPLPAHSSA